MSRQRSHINVGLQYVPLKKYILCLYYSQRGDRHVRDHSEMGKQPRYPAAKGFAESIGLRENDRVELTQAKDTITIKRASSTAHKTLEERLTAFYGKPVEEIGRIQSEELDWGRTEGSEVW